MQTTHLVPARRPRARLIPRNLRLLWTITSARVIKNRPLVRVLPKGPPQLPSRQKVRFCSVSIVSLAIPPAVHQPSSPISAPKVTKQAALQSLEQLYATKKAGLRKQLERNLEKVSLPRPTTGTGFCEIAFIPSTLTTEFTSLLGLEEVVKSIQVIFPFQNAILFCLSFNHYFST